MNRYLKWMLVFVWILVFSTAVFAQSNRLNNRLDNRAGHQGGAIEQGEQAGQSTRRQGRRVEPLGAQLNNEAQTKADGNLPSENGNRLKQPSNQAGKKIDRINQNTQAPAASR